MFTLNIPDLDVTTGSVPISWCLALEDINEIMTWFNIEPTVLIVVVPEKGYSKRKENRFVVPLKDLMTYISFRKPGTNKIFAMVFNDNLKNIKRRFLSRSDDKYRDDILNYDGDDFLDDGDSSYTKYYKFGKIRSSINVEVPEEAFAPEPSQWEKDWVLWLVQDKGADQCAFRKRKIFAYTVQPFLLALNYLVRLFATFVSASLLLRSCNLEFLKSPLQTSTFNLPELFSGRSLLFGKKVHTDWNLGDSEKSTFKNYLIYYKTTFLKYAGLPFIPLSVLIMSGIVALGGIKIISIVFAAIAIAAVLFFVVGILLTSLVKAIDLYIVFRKKPKKQKIIKEAEEKEVPKLIFTAKDIEYITCNPVNTQPSYVKIESLPAKKRSLKLRFQQLKSKVCRPFPG